MGYRIAGSVERRTESRLVRRRPISYRALDHHTALMLDLGSGGCGLLVREALEPNSKLLVELAIPGSATPGAVSHCTPLLNGRYRVGVRFTDPERSRVETQGISGSKWS